MVYGYNFMMVVDKKEDERKGNEKRGVGKRKREDKQRE